VNTETSQVDDLHLVALPSAVSCAGMFVRFTLSEWSLKSMYEEVTRTVSHRVSSIVDATDSRFPGFILVRLRVSGGYLVSEVEDDMIAKLPAGPMPPGMRMDVAPLTGRGNLMRFELPLPGGLTARAVALPRRGARRSLVEEQAEGERGLVEPEVLQRVLSSLNQWSGN
jgi:hypothetical protein